MSSGTVTLSVVLPFRDQADHVERILDLYGRTLDDSGKTWEVVAVPNACTDDTPARIARASRRAPGIVSVENPRGGWGLSVRVGLAAARGSILCYANSARTDPLEVVALLEQFTACGECLAKIRRERREAPLRSVGSWLFNLEGRYLFGVRVADVNGTPKILSRQLYDKLRLFSDGDLLDMELLAKVTRLGVPIVERAVSGFRRHGGRSRTNLASALRMLVGVFELRREMARFSET